MSKAEERKHTRFVVGGTYRSFLHGGATYAVLIGAESRVKGRRYGEMFIFGHSPMEVVEDHHSIDQWELVAEPVSPGFRERLEAMVHRIEELEQRLEEKLASTGEAKADTPALSQARKPLKKAS